MTVLERSELEASPLADLHAIADGIGLESFRRLRKAELIDAIIEHGGGEAAPAKAAKADEKGKKDKEKKEKKAKKAEKEEQDGEEDRDGEEDEEESPRPRRRRRGGRRSGGEAREEADEVEEADEPREAREREAREPREARTADGVVEVLGNGSAFLRVDPPEPSDEDVYISAAQVRRCELVSGDRVTGPVRTPRRSERYASLVRVDTINGASADSVSDGSRYEDLPVAWPAERIVLGSTDPTLEAIEWLTPLGLGSRAVIVGGRGAGKTAVLRLLLGALGGREDLDVSLVLAGARPEEIAEWGEGALAPAAALSFAASGEARAQAIDRALDSARRVAARGGNAVVLVDGLGDLPPHAAHRALAAARNLREGGSLTVIATAPAPLGGETTVIALDSSAGLAGPPMLDLAESGTLRAELLVGEDGAAAIAKARASALDQRGR